MKNSLIATDKGIEITVKMKNQEVGVKLLENEAPLIAQEE